jgi:hypothetical protein
MDLARHGFSLGLFWFPGRYEIWEIEFNARDILIRLVTPDDCFLLPQIRYQRGYGLCVTERALHDQLLFGGDLLE